MKTATIILLALIACAHARPQQDNSIHQETLADSQINDKHEAPVHHRVKRHFGLLGELFSGLWNGQDEGIGFSNDEYLPYEQYGNGHSEWNEFDDAEFNGFGELAGIVPYI